MQYSKEALVFSGIFESCRQIMAIHGEKVEMEADKEIKC